VTRRWRPAEASGCRGARARGQEERGKKSRPGEDDAWEDMPARGGARGAASAASGGGRSSAEREAARARGRRSREMSGGPICNTQKVQGLLYKLKFSH
jgi:hypothetical protein